MHGGPSQDDKEALDAQTSARLSARLRLGRQMRHMTLKMLADAAGCSESLLSKIENAKAFPSLPMLQRLAQALGTSIGWLFEPQDKPVVFRAGHRPMVALSETDDAINLECVITDPEKHLLRCDIVHIEAGAESPGTRQHPGEETGYLLQGQLELTVDGHVYALAAGDAFAFRSDRPHSYRNVGACRTSVFWVATPSVA